MYTTPNGAKFQCAKISNLYAKCDILVCVHTGLDSARCDIRVCVHAVPNEISRVKTTPNYNSARCDIRACVHAVDGL